MVRDTVRLASAIVNEPIASFHEMKHQGGTHDSQIH